MSLPSFRGGGVTLMRPQGEFFLISKIKLLALIENQLEITGTSDRLKGVLEKYQSRSPLNNT